MGGEGNSCDKSVELMVGVKEDTVTDQINHTGESDIECDLRYHYMSSLNQTELGKEFM